MMRQKVTDQGKYERRLKEIQRWWWADPAAALAMVYFLIKEGWEAIEESRGKSEDDEATN